MTDGPGIYAYLELGAVVGTHGLHGELRVHPSCDSPAFCRQFSCLYLDDTGASPVRVVASRVHKNLLLLRLEGVASIEAAQALIAKKLFFRRTDARLEEGRFFVADLLGCAVLDYRDEALCYGELCGVSYTGANDVWHIRRPGAGETLIPVIDDVVKDVDVEARRIWITPLEGLF